MTNNVFWTTTKTRRQQQNKKHLNPCQGRETNQGPLADRMRYL